MSLLGNRVELTIPDIDAAMTDFTSIRLYRASSRTGSYSLTTTITLVADTTSYAYQDTSGAATDWYKWSLYSTGTSNESQSSEPFPAGGGVGYTRLNLVRMVADYIGLYGRPPGDATFPGVSGTVTTGNTTTSFTASAWADSLLSENAYRGWYLRMETGTANNIGLERRVSGVARSTGVFTMARAFTAAPANGDTFSLWGKLSSGEWTRCLEKACGDVWTPFRAALAGTGDQTIYRLAHPVQDTSQLRIMAQQSGTTRAFIYTAGVEFDAVGLESGGVEIRFASAPAAQSVYWLEGYRPVQFPLSDTDTLTLAEQHLRILVIGGAVEAARRLSLTHGGTVEDRAAWTKRMEDLEKERQARERELRPFSSVPARTGLMVGATNHWTSL